MERDSIALSSSAGDGAKGNPRRRVHRADAMPGNHGSALPAAQTGPSVCLISIACAKLRSTLVAKNVSPGGHGGPAVESHALRGCMCAGGGCRAEHQSNKVPQISRIRHCGTGTATPDPRRRPTSRGNALSRHRDGMHRESNANTHRSEKVPGDC